MNIYKWNQVDIVNDNKYPFIDKSTSSYCVSKSKSI